MTAAVETLDAPATRAVAVATIKSVALAKVREAEPVLRALAEKYRDVVYDLKTAKGLTEAKAARHDLRENGRYAVQRAEQAVRDEANAVKKEISPEAERLIAIVQPLEDDLDKQIKAREAEIEAEKEAARAAEAARREKHERAIASIRGYVSAAKGLPSARIAIGLQRLQGMAFGDECEDFVAQYEAARDETLAALQRMHDDTLTQEQEQARLEAQRAEQQRIAAELAEQKRQLEEQAAAVAKAKAELEAQQRAAAPATEAPAVDTSASATTGTEVTPGSSQPEASPQDTSAQQEAGQAAPEATEAKASPCQAGTSSSEPAPVAVQAPATAPTAPPWQEQAAPTLKLGTICERLGFVMTAAFVADTLGVQPAATEKAAKLYRESQFGEICRALLAHIGEIADQHAPV